MSLSFGLNEPLSCPKIALFCGVMGVYFVSFFLEHPVKVGFWGAKEEIMGLSNLGSFTVKYISILTYIFEPATNRVGVTND